MVTRVLGSPQLFERIAAKFLTRIDGNSGFLLSERSRTASRHRACARASSRSGSRRTPFATALRWTCFITASTGGYKYIGGFPHFVADGGDDRLGHWLDERIDLGRIYGEIWKDAAPAHVVSMSPCSATATTPTLPASATSPMSGLNGGDDH
jgi:hypothetical protein